MIERDTVGGTRVNTGCVPSKALLAAAEAPGVEGRFRDRRRPAWTWARQDRHTREGRARRVPAHRQPAHLGRRHTGHPQFVYVAVARGTLVADNAFDNAHPAGRPPPPRGDFTKPRIGLGPE